MEMSSSRNRGHPSDITPKCFSDMNKVPYVTIFLNQRPTKCKRCTRLLLNFSKHNKGVSDVFSFPSRLSFIVHRQFILL